MASHSPFASLQSFRRDHGKPAAPQPHVFAAPVSPAPSRAPGNPDGRWLVATVEPVDKTAFGWDVAEQALEALRQGFAAQYDSTVPEALARGFAAANACVRAANRGERGRRRGERVFVGAAAMALDGQDLVFAHVPPSQIVFTQDQLVYTIPALHSWEPHYAGLDRSKAEPLGVRDQVHPDLFRTAVIERDTIVLCSTSLGRAISTLPALKDRLRPPTDPSGRPLASLPVGPAEHPITMQDMGPDRPAGADPAEAWVDWLDHVASDRNVSTCHAVAATMGQVERRSPRGTTMRSRPRERVSGRGTSEPEPAPAPAVRAPWRTADALDRAGRPRTMHQPVSPVDTPRYRRLPGANGVHRFVGSEGVRPESWRVRIPRVDLRHRVEPPRWLAVTLVLLILLAAGTGIGNLRSTAVEHDLAGALARIDDELASAESNDDASGLGTLRGQLRTLATRTGVSPELDQRWVRLTAVEDRLVGRLRLAAPAQLGQLPVESIPAERSPRLFHAGPEVFVVGDSLYELDPQSNRLIYLIGSGDTIDGREVGPILDAVATRSGIAVTDGATLFDRDGRGNWSAESFDARLDLPAGQIAAIAVYDEQMVAIDGSNGALFAIPLSITATGGVPALPASMPGSSVGALDLAVNDDLFVLGDTGNLVSFDLQGQAVPMTVPVTPPLNMPRAMDASGSNLWILDTGSGSGRLVCYSPDEDTAVVYEFPVTGIDASSSLMTASDFAVDASNSRIVFVVEDALWSVPLPVAG